MNGFTPEVWERLRDPRPTGDCLMARPAIIDVATILLCAVDKSGLRHLLIPITVDDEDWNDRESRGLNIATRELQVTGQSPRRYIDIECHDAAGHAILDGIASEIIDKLSAGSADVIDDVRRIITRWRRFWGQLTRNLLSREEQLGLFGELLYLLNHLIPAVGAEEAIRRWRGPLGARHDFETVGHSVEVKVTTSSRGRIFRIHGLDQLLPPENGRLELFGMRVRDEAGATNTLPMLVSLIRSALTTSPDTLDRFETLLLQSGYSSVHDTEYAKLKLRIIEEQLFQVEGDFPRLTIMNFGGASPPGIERIDYEINLNVAGHTTSHRSQ